MRSSQCGMIDGISKSASSDETLEMFWKMCLIRYFELRVKDAFDRKFIKMPIYLSVGQESIAASLAVGFRNPALFGQHRCHDLYIAYGGNLDSLADEFLHRETGCARGMGGSASIHSPAISMFGHDGLMGSQVPIGTGYAFATGKKTLVVMGDASAEEDYVAASLGYAATKNIPVLFVCFNNGLSILTKVEARRSWDMHEVASSFGMPAAEITDDPWLIMHYVKEFRDNLPAFLNIHTVRHLWHNGTGCDGPPEWDRFALVKEELECLGLKKESATIERKAKELADKVWDRRLSEGAYQCRQ